MEETLVWYHMEIINNILIRQGENLLSKILKEFQNRETTNKQQQESSKTGSDKWGVLAALGLELLTDAGLFSWPLLSIHICDWENRLIITCKTQTEDQKTPSPMT